MTIWTGNKNNSWNDPENWTKGLPGKNHHALIPAEPKGGHFPKVSTALTIEFTLKINGALENEALLIVEKDGVIQNDGQFFNKANATIVNYGIVMNNGRFSNQGILDNHKVFSNQGDLLQAFPSEFRAFFEKQTMPALETI